MTVTAELASARPTLEQIERIRQLSTVVFDNPGTAFDAYGYPSTRIEASNTIRTLDGMRTHENEAFIEPADEKTCGICEETKPASEFGTHNGTRDGLNRYCKDCLNRKKRESHAQEEEPMADGNTMHCGKCDTDKPLGDFAPSVQQKGHGWCRACHRDYAREKAKKDRIGGRVEPSKADRKRTRSREKSTTGSQGRTGSAALVISSAEPATADYTAVHLGKDEELVHVNGSNGDWKARFIDPTLSELESIKVLLGIPSLDDTAELCRLITGGTP